MRRWIFALVFVPLTGCATLGGPAAPQPAKPIDPASFYTGRWYEYARTPIGLTTNCVAGTTDFFFTPDGRLIERDECRIGAPTGKVKVFQGSAVMLDPPADNKFLVQYSLFGFLPFAVTYWVLDHAPDGSWFIVANPSFRQIAILGRAVPSPGQTAALTARAASLGYDSSKLEFPPSFTTTAQGAEAP